MNYSIVIAIALCAPLSWGKVLKPWTPVRVSTEGAKAEVATWGRSYDFSSNALPVSIKSAGMNLLAEPMRLVCQVNGTNVVWEKGGHWVHKAEDDAAVVSCWQQAEGFTVDASTRVEFDGMMKIGLAIVPRQGKVRTLSQAWLEIPLAPECATLFTYFPSTWSKLQNSGAVPAHGGVYPFRAYFWLGNEKGGLGWFCESDQAFRNASKDKVIEIVPTAQATLLRIRLADTALQLPATFTFGLQGTPVKPRPADFHEWQIWHAPELGAGITLPIPKDWWTCQRAFPDRQPLKKLDRAKELGVKTVVFHEDWIPIQNYPFPSPEKSFTDIVDACHARGMKVLVYQGYELSPLAPEWADHHAEWLCKTATGAYPGGWYRQPAQTDFVVCYKSPYADMWLKNAEAAMDRLHVDGFYLDSTIEPVACCNEKHGCGYRAADGSIHPTYPIFAVREMMKRLYTLVHERGGIISAHQSTCCLAATLAFADCYWDGEQLAVSDRDIKAELPLAAFRAEFMGRNHGVPCEFLAYERPPQWTLDDALAISMPHDVRVRPCGLAALEKLSPIWKAMADFDTTTAAWHPYWEEPAFIKSSPDYVKVSAYVHPETFWHNKRALLVVSNLSPSNAVTARVLLPFKPQNVLDTVSKETLSFSGKVMQIPLRAYRMRLLQIEGKDE